MKKITAFIVLIIMICSCVLAYATPSYELSYSASVENPALREIIRSATGGGQNENIWYPPQEHPYIYVNKEWIETVNANKESDNYKEIYDYLLETAQRPLPAQPEGGIVDDGISNQLKARAIMYVLGAVDDEHAKETVKYTVEYVKKAKTKETYAIYMYKDLGENAIELAAFVYDWCHGVMTRGEKNDLAEAVKALMFEDVQVNKPDKSAEKWGDLNGANVGMPLGYTSIAVTAFYDILPELYDAVMPKIQGDMATASKIYGEAGALTDGAIGYTREYFTYRVALMFSRMGYDVTEKWGNPLALGYKLLYSRLPYGSNIKQGDSTVSIYYKYGNFADANDVKEDMGLLQTMFEDPYLKSYYLRNYYSSKTIFDLILKSTAYEPKVIDQLPLAFEAYSPRSEIIHKTSWQDGFDSPQVTAYLNMNNRRSGDHDHAELGTFQLYYKGPLSISQGVYWGEAWGKPHWANYMTRTVSKNGMLIYNPSEVYKYGPRIAAANDGGQQMVSAKDEGFVITYLNEHMADGNLRVLTESSYIGPNKQTPAFSFIKGELRGAYADGKLDSYKRSMVFMDTFNKTYPGVLVVFDRVDAASAKYPKTWLLQGVAEPKINGKKVTIKNSETEPLCGGKLVNTTLYPEDVKISAVGGIGKFIADGKEWNYEGATVTSKLFDSGWRAEITPLKASDTDMFLNAMFVADADTEAPDLEFTKIEDDLFMGAAVLDRQVMFSKSGNLVEKEFSINVCDCNGAGEVMVLVTDIAPGKWSVDGKVYEVLEGDNAIVFSAVPGEYKISPAADDSKLSEINWQESEKEKIGDFYIRIGTVFQYMRNENKIVNGAPYFPLSFAEHSLDVDIKREGNTLTVTRKDGRVAEFVAGESTYKTYIGNMVYEKQMKNPPFIDEKGVFYLNHSDGVASVFGMNATYSAKGRVLACTILPLGGEALEGVDDNLVIWPTEIISSTDDGNIADNLIDRNLGTRWSSVMGNGEWVQFCLGEEAVEVSSVAIAFYNGDKRNWKFDIEISDDGKNFTKVLSDMKSGGKTMQLETFKLPKGTKTRYVRYVGHGEEVTGLFYNSLTEFVIMK